MNNKKGLLRFGSKSVLMIGALALIITSTTIGTLAWMFDKTDPVINTFTMGDIEITLTESDMDGDGDDGTNSYSFTPKAKITKDAVVTVKAGSESCWLFVEVEESDNFGDFMEYQMADGWTALDPQKYSGVWYRQVNESDVDRDFDVLEKRYVTVKSDVSQEQLDALTEEAFPTLAFSAYAIQMQSIDDPAEAWTKLNK